MLKVKIYGASLIDSYHAILSDSYKFKFIEYNGVASFIFLNDNPLEVLNEILALVFYECDKTTESLKIKRDKFNNIIVKIKPFNYKENENA